jgi:hypothetical protein
LFSGIGALASMFKSPAQLRLENIALRQQLTVLRRSAPKGLKLKPTDRIFWVWLRLVWTDWKSALMIVKAETVVAWHRKGFRLFWTWKIHRGKGGRPKVPPEVLNLIRMMSQQQSDVGCTTHSRRGAETGHRNHRAHRREVHGPTSKATFTELADLPGQPYVDFFVYRRSGLRFSMCFWCWHTTAGAFSISE